MNKPKRKPKPKPQKYYIGIGHENRTKIFQDAEDCTFPVSRYKDYFFVYGPYETFQLALSDSLALGLKVNGINA